MGLVVAIPDRRREGVLVEERRKSTAWFALHNCADSLVAFQNPTQKPPAKLLCCNGLVSNEKFQE